MEGRVSYLAGVRAALGGTVNSVAEIGVLRGRFSAALLEALDPRSLDLVDPWRPAVDPAYRTSTSAEWDARYRHVVGRFGSDSRVHIHRMDSLTAAARMDAGSFDLVYLDADHREASVFADLQAWFPKVRRGGFIAGHDFTPDDARTREVVSACRRFFGDRMAQIVSPLESEPGRGFPRSFFYQVPA